MVVSRTVSTVNRGGSAEDNPILNQETITIKLNKHDSSETIKKCWIQVGRKVFSDLTSLVVSLDESLSVDVTAGVHLKSGSSPVKNVVHFTTSGHRHVKNTIWVADNPPVMITLDGYNSNDPAKPLIYPFYEA